MKTIIAQMNTTQKINQIEKWYKQGKIKKLSANCFSVPCEAFVMGITPTLVAKVLKKK